ncbi:MAG: acetamidase/formamidase family protein [Thermogemmatispora sp.]|jgi:acetamidase/formamidase|uniref:Acetamidase n=1 Tax=Thermogemmatispora aurantia TaxID=2045279 RepID=A0A5J4KF37_9CHLR|nr:MULTISPECIES: acetamidase/formamidase family protein [Thermogemmatispora]MBE3567502.1 acetamidase/formamidase family protein [Thermogemmatispora sp.]GER85130.1 acetamidase [Thermogemmatispora aurantia]
MTTDIPKAGRTIHIRRDQWHLAWDHSIPPIARISSGEVVEFDMLEASCGQIQANSTVEAIGSLDFSRVDQVHGPIYVEGAEPGDTLEVEFLDLQPAEWGWTGVIPGFGLLADEFPEPALKIWHLEGGADGWAEFAPGIRIPLAPFCGEIGLAPGQPGALPTIPPYRHGGNMDTRHLTKGTRLYLPVEVPGALFSMGDGHAAQGDGEVCGTAIETPMHAVVRLTVHKDRPVPEPQYLTGGPLIQRTNTAPYYVTDGIGPDLMEATRNAIRHMIDHLQRNYGLSRSDAYMLCSVAVDLKICEVVDAPHWVVGAFLPTSIFTK